MTPEQRKAMEAIRDSHADEEREHLKRPFSLEVNGDIYDVVTDGHIVVALDAHGCATFDPLAVDALKLDEFLGSVLLAEAVGDWKPIPVARLREVADPAKPTPCQHCGGTGEARRECEFCERTHDCHCSFCYGVGFDEHYDLRGSLAGRLLRLHLLWRIIQTLPPADVVQYRLTPQRHGDGVAFKAEGWHAVQMPLASTPSEVAEFPAIDIESEASHA